MVCLQASEVQAAQVQALQLLVRLEALQRDVTSTAHLHRVLFQRLATASRNAGGAGTAPPGADMASNSGPGEEQHALQTFLQHHFGTDALLNEMQVQSRSFVFVCVAHACATGAEPVTAP